MAFGKAGGDRLPERDPRETPTPSLPGVEEDGGSYYGGPAQDPGDDPSSTKPDPAAVTWEDPLDNQDVTPLPPDQIGDNDIPPPPPPYIPPAPTAPQTGVGVAGLPGTEGSTFTRPGTQAAARFRTPAFLPARPPRFGPGVPMTGGAPEPFGPGDDATLDPERAAELLRSLAAGKG